MKEKERTNSFLVLRDIRTISASDAYVLALIPFIYILVVVFNKIDMLNLFPYVFIWLISIPLFILVKNDLSKKIRLSLKHVRVTGENMFIILTILALVLNSARRIIIGNYGIIWLFVFLCPIVMFIDGVIIYSSRREMFVLAMQILNIFVCLTAIWGVVEYLYFALFLHQPSWRVFSIYTNPFKHGGACLFALFFPGFTNNKKVNLYVKLLYICNIVLTFSRNLWLGLFFVVLILSFTHKKELKKSAISLLRNRSVVLIIVILFGILLISGAMSSIVQRFHIDTAGESFVVRTSYARYFADVLYPGFGKMDYLIGRGYRSSRAAIIASGIQYNQYEVFDNMYITLLYEFGIIGFLLAVLVIYRAFCVLKHNREASLLENLNNIPFAFSLIVLSAVIPAFFFDIYEALQVSMLLMLGWAVVNVEYVRICGDH